MKVNGSAVLNEIIIVGKGFDQIKLLSDILTSGLYSVFVIENMGSALQVIEQKFPSLIIIDTLGSADESYELCTQLKANPTTLQIPVVFIGSTNDEKVRLKAWSAGCLDFIGQPFSKEEILIKVNNAINSFRQHLELSQRNEHLEKELIRYRELELNLQNRINALILPEDQHSEIAFESMFDVEDLQKLQDQFAHAFGIASIITDTNGKPITRPSNFSNLCQNIIRKTEKGLINCMYSDSIIGCHNSAGPTVMPCLSGGLLDAGASITVGGKHVANWLIGQIRNESTDTGRLKEYAKEIGVDEKIFMDAFYEVTPMPLEQFNRIAEMLFTLAKQLSLISYHNVRQAQFIHKKLVAEEALKESEERFRTILYSIGDGVITTDHEGKVKIMNPVAEQLTGWSQQEAKGKLLEEVFDIVNEETRAQVEIPVRRVLREGIVVGLANHTVLIAKDGTEYPIADSGAPVRNDKGEILGVVLIFRDQSEDRRSEYELRESEKQFKLLYENAPLSYQSLDTQARLIDVNPTWLATLGYERDEVIGRFFGDFMTPESAELIKNRFANFVKAGEIHDYRFEMVRKNGNKFLVSYDGKISYDENGQFKKTHCIFTDITQRQLAENVLKESEFKFRGLYENSSVGISVTAIDGTMKLNKAFSEMLGYTEAELRNKKWQELTHPEDIQKNMDELHSLLKGEKKVVKFEKRYLHKNGNVVWVDLSITLQKDENDQPLYYITSANDITKRKLIEEALRESEYFFRESQHAAFVGSYKFNIINGMWESSEVLDEIFGIDKHYHRSLEGWQNIIHEDDRAMMTRYLSEEVIGKRKSFNKEYRIVRLSDGEVRWVNGLGKLTTDKNNQILSLIGTIQDVTERKQAEEAILNEKQLLRTLIDNLPVTIYVKDIEGRKIVANKADLEVIGVVSETDVLGKTDLDTFNDEIGKRGYEDDLKVIETGKAVINREEIFLDKNGQIRWLLTSKIPIRDQGGTITGLVGIGRDITDQKKANETILKFSKSIEQSPSTIVITDIKGDIEYVNPKFTDVTGYTLEEVIGKNPRILKSGEMSPLVYKNLWETISSGEVWRGEFHNRKKNGELFWELVTMTSIKNEEGVITNYISIKEDITARKKMEADLIIAKEKAEENDRLKSAFLANMSHEIRTPLNSIIGFSELLADPEFQSDDRYEFARIITNSGNNLLSIISDIMDISKIEAGQVEVRKNIFSVRRLVQDIYSEYRFKAFTKGIELQITPALPEGDILIESDQTKIKQVLVNFVGNALKFTETGSIKIGIEIIDRSVLFKVSDTGIGIPEKYHSRIFERFRQVEGSYTRKYGGNGLGLAISKSLIEMLGGKIGMNSETGKGSTFYFVLPDVVM